MDSFKRQLPEETSSSRQREKEPILQEEIHRYLDRDEGLFTNNPSLRPEAMSLVKGRFGVRWFTDNECSQSSTIVKVKGETETTLVVFRVMRLMKALSRNGGGAVVLAVKEAVAVTEMVVSMKNVTVDTMVMMVDLVTQGDMVVLKAIRRIQL
ncbi:hypothetical protein L6452_01830 [Arctium lappa]|uniref:Uncharacterized protein n=1 Tax=Arctium lappa TaxID=4217 RepID=A0ACB9FHV2_ARCLA|nr:hypothetical protein L6452_01830 [Arctium lappa]